MIDTSDRTWALPKSPWIMRMIWSELLFAHWPVDASKLSQLIPSGLTLDTRDGTAWIGVVPFVMSDVAPRACPAVPKFSRFLELNVRTYVIRDGKPGVWFFSLDAACRLAVRAARYLFHLPYTDARMSMIKDDKSQIHYSSQRTDPKQPPAQFVARYESIGNAFHAQPGTLEHWLTARYCMYCSDRRGRIYRGEIAHQPWSLSRAECIIETNTMGHSLGLDLSAPPHLLYAQPVATRVWYLNRCA